MPFALPVCGESMLRNKQIRVHIHLRQTKAWLFLFKKTCL
jgi:hypothetical protein